MYKLLIVDDEAIERDAVKFIIDKSDLTFEAISEAVNGQEAISVAAVFEPDIIMMDIRMPGLDGIESSKIIKKIKEETKIIFLTAFDEFEHAKEGIKIGVEDFVVKPASNERIIEVLQNAINALEREKTERKNQAVIEEKLKQVSKYLESEFIGSVIEGTLSSEQMMEYADFMQLQGTCGFGVVVMLHYDQSDNPTSLQRQMMKKRLMEKLDEKLATFRVQYFLTHNKDYINILVLDKDVSELYAYQDRFKETLLELTEYASEKYSMYIDLGIGDIKEHVEDIWKSFSMAKASCQKKVYTRKDETMGESLHRLVRCILECDEAHLEVTIGAFYDVVVGKTQDLESFKVKMYEQLVLLKQTIYDEVPIQFEDSSFVFKRLMALESIPDGKTFTRDFVLSAFNLVKEQKLDKTVVIMDKLIAYINSHYNENITLEQLSQMSGFSLHYLSKVFKKHLDMNFSDYLSYIRIKVAKRLLKNPAKSVKEISFEVGYIDPNYFARVFKKYEHMTPTEYRSKNMAL